MISFLLKERHQRIYTESYECRAYDTQHFAVLQLVGANDVVVLEDHESNDQHVQEVYTRGLLESVGDTASRAAGQDRRLQEVVPGLSGELPEDTREAQIDGERTPMGL